MKRDTATRGDEYQWRLNTSIENGEWVIRHWVVINSQNIIGFLCREEMECNNNSEASSTDGEDIILIRLLSFFRPVFTIREIPSQSWTRHMTYSVAK
jgi:hypothetical protein